MHFCTIPKTWAMKGKTDRVALIKVEDLVIIPQTWKQPRCSLIGEWINKLCYLQTMKYYPMRKTREPSSHEKTSMKRKCTWRNESSLFENTTYCMIPTTWHPRKGHTMRAVKRAVISRDVGREGWTGRVQSICRPGKVLCIKLQWWIHVIIHCPNP